MHFIMFSMGEWDHKRNKATALSSSSKLDITTAQKHIRN